MDPGEIEKRASTAVDPARLKLLATLARGLDERLRAARLVDRASLYREAATSLPSTAIGGVVLCDVGEAPPAALAFLERLARTHPAAAISLRRTAEAAPRRDARARRNRERLGLALASEKPTEPATSLQRLQSRLFAGAARASATEPAPLDASVAILAAAGEALEAIEIARSIRQGRKRGLRLQEVAVFLHDSKTYAAALASAFERAGIEAFFLDGVPRVDPAARALGLLLDLVGGDLDRLP